MQKNNKACCESPVVKNAKGLALDDIDSDHQIDSDPDKIEDAF